MLEYLKAFFSIIFKFRKPLNNPISVIFDATTECNLKCIMCSRNEPNYIKPEKAELSIDIVKRVFLEIKPKLFSFGGFLGDPLLNKNISDFVKVCTDNGCKSLMTTNGHLLSEETSRSLIENGVHMIKVSLDSATKETYLKIRQNAHFDKVIENIKTFCDLEKEIKGSISIIRLEFVIQNDNLHEVVPFLHLAKRLKIKNICYLPLCTLPISNDTAKKLISGYDLRNIVNTLKEAIEVSSQLKIKTNLPFLLKGSEKIKDLDSYLWKENDFYFPWRKYACGDFRTCFLPWIEMTADLNGDISICCVPFTFGRDGTGLVIGNLYKDNLHDIWHGEKAQAIRQMSRDREIYKKFEICRLCVNRPNIWAEIKKNNIFS